MSEYIEREAAVAKITELINQSGKYTDYECGADDACYIVNHIQAADVRPVKRGTWCEAVPKWISVEERLPEQNVPCIVYNKYYGPMIGWRVDGERFRIPGSRFPDHPTHWMPLPPAPKGET